MVDSKIAAALLDAVTTAARDAALLVVGPNDRLQADLIDFSQNTRGKTKYGLVVMDVTREAAVEPLQNKNAETVGRATKRAARKLTGDDGNFVVTTDLGNKFATDRGCPRKPCTGRSGPRTATPLPWWTGASRR